MREENVQNVNVTNMVPLHVRVTRIDVPLGDIVSLTFQILFASILVGIVLAIPAFIVFDYWVNIR